MVQLCPAMSSCNRGAFIGNSQALFQRLIKQGQKNEKKLNFQTSVSTSQSLFTNILQPRFEQATAKDIEGPSEASHLRDASCIPRPTKVFTAFACFRCFPSTCAIRYLVCTEARPMSQGPSPREGHGRRLYKMYQNATCPTRSVLKAIQNPKRLRRGCSPSEMLHL